MNKQILLAGSTGFMVALLLMITTGFNSPDEPLMMEDPSLYDFETTVERFEEEIHDAGWSIINTHNMQQMLRRHGHEVNSVKVFEVCSAGYSAEILKLDDERIISPLMPCRISIYEKSDGSTYIARMDNKRLSKPYGGVIEEVMAAVTHDMEDIIGRLTK